jgi:RNA-splicing ligase RtcB
MVNKMEIKGKYGTAIVYATVVDETTKEQIKNLMDQKFTKDLNVRIMADCHAGTGCVIGTTMNINDCVVTNLVGVDIGCGMLTVKLGKMDIDLIKLDRFVRKKIPSGLEIYSEEQVMATNIENLKCYEHLAHKSRHKKSMGTLGGGNHFIEIDKDDEDNLYLIIHTGSRNLGKQVCEYYTTQAKKDYLDSKRKNIKSLINRYKRLNKEEKIQEGIEKLMKKYNSIDFTLLPVYGKTFEDYMFDMDICQKFAWENREAIANKIMEYLGLELLNFEYFHTIHNYINMEDKILRKGSISAYVGEEVLIPINMRDGSIIARGKSNSDFNYSAPHGAGRILSRSDAFKSVTLAEFKEAMEGIYSTSVQESTIDESPFAYKSIEDIIPNILPTVDIVKLIKPIYNFKACRNRGR